MTFVFYSDGVFYFDVRHGNDQRLYEAAAELVDQTFADELEVRVYPDQEALLFIFQNPRMPPNCLFAIARKTETGYSYVTFERTLPIGDSSGGVAGGWSSDGTHYNMGSREYDDYQSFVAEFLLEGQ